MRLRTIDVVAFLGSSDNAAIAILFSQPLVLFFKKLHIILALSE